LSSSNYCPAQTIVQLKQLSSAMSASLVYIDVN